MLNFTIQTRTAVLLLQKYQKVIMRLRPKTNNGFEELGWLVGLVDVIEERMRVNIAEIFLALLHSFI